MLTQRTVQVLGTLMLLCASMLGQTVTSSLVGVLTDPASAVVPKAQLELKDNATGAIRKTESNEVGLFRFVNVPAGTYSLSIKAQGFTNLVQTDIALASSSTRDLGRIQLQLGALTQQVNVTAETTPVQTASSEKGSLVTGNDLLRLAVRSRDMMSFLTLVPGVTGLPQYETPNVNAILDISINGSGVAKTTFTVDGILNQDPGSLQTSQYEPNMDAIAEIRVLTSSYQAEYGRGVGGVISVISKSGGQSFHGTGWATKRHEMFNAKNYFDNFNNFDKPIYRYFIGGFSLGGPIYIPKLFNTDKSKFFFFVSQEYTKQKPGTATINGLAPTVLERNGDFSKSLDNTGKLIPLFDPITRQPVPNNTFAPSLGNTYGKAMMNYFPLPNRCDLNNNASGCYTESDSTQINRRNYRSSVTLVHPRRNDMVRIDGRLTPKLSVWYRFARDYDNEQTSAGISLLTSKNTWEPFFLQHPQPGYSHGVSATYVITPNLVNEFTFGRNYNGWDYYFNDSSQMDRARMGNPPHWFDEKSPNFANDGNLPRPYLPNGYKNFQYIVPRVQGGTMSNPGTGYPEATANTVYSFSDSISWVRGAHSVKAGVYWEPGANRIEAQANQTQTYTGTYNFSSSTSFPLDTGYGNANMFLGNFNSYSELGRELFQAHWKGIEAFVQDNWRIHKRLTLDLGVRFYHFVPYYDTWLHTAVWNPSSYDPAKAGRLYQRGCLVVVSGACPTASRVAVDPVTGTSTYAALADTFVPASVGGYATTPNFFNGMEIGGASGSKVPGPLWKTPAVTPAIRLGLAWDVFGNGKTAIRTGFGQFIQRGDQNVSINWAGQPPVTYTRTIYYANINDIPSFKSTSGGILPTGAGGIVGDHTYESSMNTSFGIQQHVGFGTVVEASYVGAFYRHKLQTREKNPIPMFSQYNPIYMDPWSANTPKRSINNNNLRPLQGLGGVTNGYFEGSRNYNSLQVTVRRAMSHGISYGLAYTFSKTMSASPSPYWPDKYRNYGASGQPHVLAVNYVYEVPMLGKRLGSKPLGWVTDNWMISGITSWQGLGRMGVPSYSFSGTTTANPAPVQTGSSETARMIVLRNATLPSDKVTFYNTFDWQAFGVPMPCSWTPQATPQKGIGQSMDCFGNAGAGNLFTIPTRLNNWDMTFAKGFPFFGEHRMLMFRAEMYNIFNHTQFNGINSSIQYDLTSWQNGTLVQTNNQLGRFTSARDPRRMAMTLRFEF